MYNIFIEKKKLKLIKEMSGLNYKCVTLYM